MGQRISEPDIVYGDDCLLKFDEGKTPKYVYARFSNIKACPIAPRVPPNDRTFKLTQLEGLPCKWTYAGDKFDVAFEYIVEPPSTHLIITGWPPLDYYFWSLVDGFTDEGEVVANEYTECVGTELGHGGIGVVTWQLQTLKIMKSLNINPSQKLFMEMHPLVDGNKVYKLCQINYGMNIAIEFESD